ncbi:cell wall-binding repeat-containing protein [Lagierella sp. ICN-221743]
MNSKTNYLKRTFSFLLALAMIITAVPARVFAEEPSGNADATSSATYYTKPNWEARIKDKSRWKVEDSQTLVRVSTSDPVEMNDIDYDGMYINANGRYVIRLIYKEKTQAVSAVWHRALINFGDLDQYIDFGNSYVFGRDGKTKYTFDPVTGIKGRGFDLRSAVGDRTNNRKNLPINLVLKDGVTLETLPKKNYIIQMRLTNSDYKRVYSYAPLKSSMDYSTYTKTTSVSLEDNLNNLFIKGGLQADSNNATNQEFFMSEFIANPDQYKDEKNLGIIRTQYMGQRAGSAATPTVGDEPIAFTQVFDANLLHYLKEDDKGYVGYVNVLTDVRDVSPYSHNFGFTKNDINRIKVDDDTELAYVVIAPAGFKKKNDVKVVGIPQHDQYTMLSGIYITAIDYVVDKSEFENTFSSKYTRKLDYSTMSGWTNPNDNGWPVYERKFDNDYVVQEGDSFMVDAGAQAEGKQIMIQVGGEQAILRRPQGYYNGYNSGKAALDNFEEIAKGVFQFTIGEGTTVKSGKSLKIYMPYTKLTDAPKKLNFLEIHNGTKINEGAATLTLQKDRNINMHLYKQGKKGHFVLRYTLANGTESSLKFEPKLTWSYEDKDEVLTGAANKATLPSGGNFYIDTTKLEPGTDIIVESYDKDGNEIASEKSWFKYISLEKSPETVKLLTWTDHSDKRSVLSINKSLYTPYQVLFTNDYVDGVDDFYKDPRVLPADNAKFNTDTTKIVGYTKYDSGKVRTLYEGPQKLFGKVEADGNEYDDKGNLAKPDVRKDVTIAKKDLFDAQFAEDSKTYKAFEYTFDLEKMLPYHSDDKTETKLTLLKDMKFVSTASDGSSLPSDLIETRVRARVLFDANTGSLTEDSKQVDKVVKIVPDNVKFYGEEGYAANGFEGANADTNTGDKFPEAPKLEGKNFLGWVTEEGKQALGNKAVVEVAEFNKLDKEKVFTNTTPVEKHLVVYAIYSKDTVVTFDANGGAFEGGKDELTVKADAGSVTKPTAPTKEGYNFLGWADKKDATTANVTDFSNVDASKTVYAVWEQAADKKLDLKDPENPVPVLDKTDLTEKEKDAVKEAVIKANPDAGLTKDMITVASDGKVTVTTADGKTGELTPDKTVKQKEVINNINPPKKPIEVKNLNGLTDDEKNKVKDAIIEANPDLNLKPEEVTVDEKGNVTIDQGGKTGTVPAEKTVVEESKIINLNKPIPVEVKDINNLTPTEKEAVKEAVIAKNNGLTKEQITVDGNGNVTVTDGDKTGTLEGKDTVKLFNRFGKKLNDPKELTEVSDKTKLTQAEKEAVREAVKAANPDLNFKDEEIQVADNGKVTVPMGTDGSGNPITETIEPEKTVKEDDKTKTISLKAPKVTVVKDPTSLTDDEKATVKEAVIKANPDIKTGYDITVANDGSVSVEKDGKVGMLAQADTVVKKLDAPKIVSDEDGSVKVGPKDNRTSEIEVTYKDPQGKEQKIIAKKENGEWKLVPEVEGVKVDKKTGVISIPGDKIQNGSDVKAVAKDGDNKSDDSEVTSKDNKAPNHPEVKLNDNNSVTVTPPKDKDTKTVKVTITNPDGTQKEFVVEKDGDNWKLPANAPEGTKVVDGKITIPADKIKPGAKVSASATDVNDNTSSTVGVTTKSQTDDVDPIVPKKVGVADPNSLTENEQKDVKKAIEDANKTNFPTGTKVDVGKDGTATITYPDGSTDTIEGSKLVEKVDKTELQKEVDKNKNDAIKNSDKYKNADQTKKDAYDSALDKAKKVLEDPHATQEDVDEALQQLKEAEAALKGNASDELNDPSRVAVKDPSNLTDAEKAAIKKAVKDANPGLKDNQIAVDKEGNVTVTKEGEEPKTIGKDKTVSTDIKTPELTEVANPASLTDDEKAAVKRAVEDANKDGSGNSTLPEGATITVGNDGTVTVKDKDGKETIIPASDTVKEKATPGSVVAPAEPVKVKDPSNLTDKEKEAVKQAVKDANPKLPADATIDVADDGTVTVKDKDGNEIGKLKPEKTVKPAVNAPAEPVKVKDPSNLTPDEKEAVKQAVKDANPKLPADATIEVGNDGTVTVTDKDGKPIGTIPADKTVKSVLNAPTKPVEVADPSNLTPDEKKAVEDAVKKANLDLPADAKVTVGNDGTVTVTDKDGQLIGKLTPKQTVKKIVNKKPLKDEIDKGPTTKAGVKYTNASESKKKAYDKALDEAKKVLDNPNATQDEVNAATKALKAAEEALDGTTSGGTSTPTTPTKPSETTEDSPKRTTDRTMGKDRVETAIEISKKYFGQADTVIVVDKKDFPDAMTASVLSKLLKAPILLTDTNKLDPRVAAEIKRLGARDVIIVGGNKSVSEAVKKELAKFDKDNVERIYGKDRYETSAQVARRVVGITGKLGHAVVASGEIFADALTVAPYASREGYPILLVKYNSLPPTVNKAIKDLSITKVTIAGGYSTVSKPLEKSLPTVVERLSGPTRYETAIDIATKKFNTNKIFLANGKQWMDALVIGPVGGILDMPILLTSANSAPKSLKDYIAKANIEKITAIGGRSMVSDRVLNELSK